MRQTHIQLVSVQLAGNLIPALMEQPDEAVLIVTPAMERQAERLRRLQEEAGIAVRMYTGAPDANVPHLREFALEVISDLDTPGEVVLNLTGGNKLMALGFLEMLRDTVDRRIYTDTANGRLEHIAVGEEGAETPTPLASVLDVPISLRAQGFEYRSAVSADPGWQRETRERKQVAKALATVAAEHEDFLGALNHLATLARDDAGELVRHRQDFAQRPHGRWRSNLDWLSAQGMLDWDGGEDVDFLDTERTAFLNGGWLEEYVYHRLRDEGIDDVALGVEGTWEGTQGVRNELDIAAVHANRLLVVECKTARHGRDAGVDDQQLYKLDSIADNLRGFFGEAWMVSARTPTATMRERAHQHNIRLIGPADLPRLRDLVREWKQKVEPSD